jgi:Repeat of unknown function (DUF5907)
MSFSRPPLNEENVSAWVWKQWFTDLYKEVIAAIAGIVSDGDKGDITISAGATVYTIDSDVVTNAKLANVNTQTFKGRTTAGTGDPEDLTVAQAKTLLNLSGTNTGDQTITLTSDVTGSGTGSFATTIAADAVTNTKLANMSNSTLKGRYSAGTGDPEDVTASQARAIIFGTTPTDFGDLTIDGSSATGFTIENDAVTNAKMANMATKTIKGRTTAGTGDPEDLTAAQALAVVSAAGPKFVAYRNANESIASGAWTRISMNNELYDTNTNYDPTTNYRFTPSVAGYYRLSTIARWGYAPAAAGQTQGLRLYLNGATELGRTIQYPVNGVNSNQMHATTLYYFNGSTDYVEVQAYQDSGANQNIIGAYADCQFCGEYVGA